HGMVIGVRGVGARAKRTDPASDATDIRAGRLPGTKQLLRCCAACYPGGNQVRKSLSKPRIGGGSYEWVAINRLEQVRPAIAGVARLESRVLADLSLEPKSPAIDTVG